MKTYANSGHGMATVIFTDGDGIILKRGEKKQDPRTARWIDVGVKVSESVKRKAPDPVKETKEDKVKV